MARARNIKPGFFKNPELGECEPLARLLFAGLWCLSDREGRLEFRPKLLKIELLPYDDCDIGTLIAQLESFGFVECYEVDGIEFLQVDKFIKHQRPHHMEVPSEIPPPDSRKNRYQHLPIRREQRERILTRDRHRCVNCSSTERLHIDHKTPVAKGGTSDDDNLQTLCRKCNLSKGSRFSQTVDDLNTSRTRVENRSSSCADSLSLDSLNPSSSSASAEEARALRDHDFDSSKTTRSKPQSKRRPPVANTEFDSWYAAYPRKVHRKTARAAYPIAVKGIALTRGIPVDEAAAWLLSVTQVFAATPAGRSGQFVPYPATWLRAGAYDDDQSEWQRERTTANERPQMKPFTVRPGR